MEVQLNNGNSFFDETTMEILFFYETTMAILFLMKPKWQF